jgi:hypothetical protein
MLIEVVRLVQKLVMAELMRTGRDRRTCRLDPGRLVLGLLHSGGSRLEFRLIWGNDLQGRMSLEFQNYP